MLHYDVLPTTRAMDFRGVHHFVEGHGEFSLIKLLRIPDCFRCDTQLRLGQERGGETIGRWYRRYVRPGRRNEQLTHAHDQPAVRALISRERGQWGGTRLPAPPACAPEYRGKHSTNVPLTGMADALFLIQGGERTGRFAAGAGHDGVGIGRQTNTKV